MKLNCEDEDNTIVNVSKIWEYGSTQWDTSKIAGLWAVIQKQLAHWRSAEGWVMHV